MKKLRGGISSRSTTTGNEVLMAQKVYRKAGEEGSTREQRGVSLYLDRGDEVVLYPTTGEFGVPSQSEEGVLYVVNLDHGICSCADSRHRAVGCKHVAAATIYAAKVAAGRRGPGSHRSLKLKRSRCRREAA